MSNEEGSSLTQTLQRSLIELTPAYDATIEVSDAPWICARGSLWATHPTCGPRGKPQ
ncbi:MAG: hypothetical protein ABSB41_12300 [Anaerolineales bacterium]